MIALAIGLVPAVILSWAFEWTPEGIRRDSEVMVPVPAAPMHPWNPMGKGPLSFGAFAEISVALTGFIGIILMLHICLQ